LKIAQRKGQDVDILPFSYCIFNTIKTLPIAVWYRLCFCSPFYQIYYAIPYAKPYFPANFILAMNYLLFIFTAVNTSFPRFVLVKHLLTKK